MSAPTLQFGLIRGESIEAYHAADALSKSKLGDFRESPLLYFRRYVAQNLPRRAMTPAFLTGQGAHVLTLEGLDAYAKAFAVVPQGAPARPTEAMLNAAKPSPSSLERQAYWKAFDADNAGKTLIDYREFEMHKAIAKSVHAHPIAAALLSEGEPELTFRVEGRLFPIQCRPDWINFGASHELSQRLNALGVRVSPGEPYMLDLKTVEALGSFDFLTEEEDASPRSFTKNFFNFEYHQQGPLYRSVIKSAIDIDVEKFFYVAASKSDTMESAVFLPDDDANALGWEEICRDMDRINECYKTGVWPGAPKKLLRVSLPSWYLKRAEVAS